MTTATSTPIVPATEAEVKPDTLRRPGGAYPDGHPVYIAVDVVIEEARADGRLDRAMAALELREREAEDLAIIEAWKLREPPQPPTAVEQAAFEREEQRIDDYLATGPRRSEALERMHAAITEHIRTKGSK